MRIKINADIIKWQELFATDGYRQHWTHTDPPGYFYPEHSHPIDSAHVVLKGSMVVHVGGTGHTLHEGDRFDVPKDVVHTAKIGPHGCTFLIGVRV